MFADPQFWVAVAFILFVIAIFNPIRKILGSSLDSKINEIKKSIEEAENLKNETRIALSDIQKRQNEVKSEISAIHSEAKEKIRNIETQAKAKLLEQTDKRELNTKAKIEQITRDANLAIQQNITQTAIEAAVTLLEKKLNQDEKQKLINNSIKELQSVFQKS